jgi:branched-chain amino acid transport system substrate-binding protein
MDKAGTSGVHFDNEGSGYGFRTVLALPAERTVLPTVCKMQRP